jgi:anti-sigma-K factor RskA
MTDRPDERFDDADMAELGDLVRRARAEEIEWEPPPEGLWDRIAASLEAEPATAPEPVPANEPAAEADVVPIAGRRRSWWLAVAAAAAVVAVGVTAALALGGDGDDTRVVSAVELERLGPSGSGRAELVDHDGSLQLRVDTSELDAGDGYLELWLIDPSVSRLVSLGPLRPDGVYDVPTGVDPAEFPIVDVSVEPIDGDPTHSGQSVLRGQLTL